MSATRSTAAPYVPADSAARRSVAFEEQERLPPGVAYTIILLMSVACWGLVATVGLWLLHVLG